MTDGATNDAGDGDVVAAKGTAMAVLCCASLVMGLLPLKLRACLGLNNAASISSSSAITSAPKDNVYVSALLALGGGVLLCTTFVHLVPEVGENVEALQKEGRLPDLPFPLAEALMCAGFFAMYLVEEVVHWHMHRREQKTFNNNNHNKQQPDDVVLHRTLSIRRSGTGTSAGCNGAAAAHDDARQQRQATDEGSASFDVAVASTAITVTPSKSQRQGGGGGGGGHGHSHMAVAIGAATGSPDEDPMVAGLRGLLVVLALSVHELFEGLAVGLEESAATVWYMFGAVSAHKFVIAFCIGVELVTSGTRTLLTVAYVALFAVVSPLGIGIGLALTHSGTADMETASVFLQGLASGTLLYVVFFEILQRERTEGFRQMIAVMLGFLLMFALQFLSGHEH